MKKTKEKVNAAIIIIGNEILSGRTQDVNVVAISLWLNELGVKLDEVRVIPDIEKSIIQAIKEIRKKFNYIFTTGGIGPTHDDITSKSIAKAFNLKYGYHKEAYSILERYYGKAKFTSGRKKMSIQEVLKLGKGSVIELTKLAGEPIDIYVNQRKLAEGEVVVVDENFAISLSTVLTLIVLLKIFLPPLILLLNSPNIDFNIEGTPGKE